ncbi:hypothetical protein [Candidatus Doolittlea endobia]|uniref:hypothetical protein n=1 Tax=Candidatus Doolittlea endobia TaxID=1778262 RepID=UPI0038BCDEE9
MRRALLSISDKTDILIKSLFERGVELITTSGTVRFLTEAGLPVTAVFDYTEFPK